MCSYRSLTPLAPEAVAAGHQVVSVGTNVTVGLDVLFGWKCVGHLPGTAVPNPAFIDACAHLQLNPFTDNNDVYRPKKKQRSTITPPTHPPVGPEIILYVHTYAFIYISLDISHVTHLSVPTGPLSA